MNTSRHSTRRSATSLPPNGATVLFTFSSGGQSRRMKGVVLHRAKSSVDIQVPGGRVSVPASEILGGWPPKK